MRKKTQAIKFDRLQMYFGDPYTVDIEGVPGKITIYQPTIGNIVSFGEQPFYQTLNVFVTNTTSHRLMLWENGFDWNELSDFELFVMLYKTINPEASKLIFKDLDFQKFEPLKKRFNEEDEPELILYNQEDDIEINSEVYNYMSQYLRNVFNIFPEEKFTTDLVMKKWYINKDKRQLAIDKEKAEKGELKQNSSIQPVISACINHPGFKYTLEELKNVGVCEFYDSVKRLQVFENTTALLKGVYSGFVDGKNIKSDEYNFMREF